MNTKVYVLDDSQFNSNSPLLSDQQLTFQQAIKFENRKYLIWSAVSSSIMALVLILSAIWLLFLASFDVINSKDPVCLGVAQFIPHLNAVSILTVVCVIANITIYVTKKYKALLGITLANFIIFCYRVVLMVVWIIAGSNSFLGCLNKNEKTAQSLYYKERFGFYLTIVLIFIDFGTVLMNFYLSGRVKQIQEFQKKDPQFDYV